MKENIILNFSDLLILTPNGYEPFWALSKARGPGVKLTFEDGTEESFSIDHTFVKGGVRIPVTLLDVGDTIFGRKIVKVEDVEDVFIGPYGIPSKKYFTIDQDGKPREIHHNCELLGSSTTLIPLSVLANQVAEDPVRYEYSYSLAIWEEPDLSFTYVMGVDPATGSGRDFSAIQVIKIVNKNQFEQVASYSADRVSPHEFSKIVWEVSKMYGEARIIIENNGSGALIAEEVWYDFGCTNIINTDPRGIGTKATHKSKMEACMMLQREFERGSLKVRDESTLKELRSFEEVAPNKFSAPSGQHDDLVSALYWAIYCLHQPEIGLDDMDESSFGEGARSRNDEEVGPRILGEDDFWL